MGNALSTSSRLTVGVGNLVAEVGSDVQYEKSIGSSRFLKAIRARHSDGPLVIKIFLKADPGMSLRNLVRRMRVEREALSDVPNVLTYQKVIETERAGYLIRQWLASNLYDRISTRPFLSPIEKKWITYQLLFAMRAARAKKVAHGDLKSENVLVTSSLSIYITDFAASFKPTFLPLDDPADFSFFFDTSGRRTCYVAPERFYEADSEIAQKKAAAKASASFVPPVTSVKKGETPSSGVASNSTASTSVTSSGDPYAEILGLGKRDGKVTEAMDVFSLGCVIAELWRDGAPIFTLSQLFKYREGLFDVEAALTEIPDVAIRALVRSMINLDPSQRQSFDAYMIDARATGALPEEFYTLLHEYLTDLQRTTTAHASTTFSRQTSAAGPPPSVAGGPSEAGLAQPVNSAGNGGVTALRTEADERVERLYEDWAMLTQFITDGTSSLARTNSGHLTPPPPEKKEDSQEAEHVEHFFPVQLSIPDLPACILEQSAPAVLQDGLAIILLSVILANIRNCLRPSSKLHALELLMHLASHFTTDETKLDRIIPFVIALIEDGSATVRAAAVRTCTQILLLVKVITPSNASIIAEYVIPNIRQLSLDHSPAVRTIYATCIVPLSHTGERFLQMAQAMNADGMFAVEQDTVGHFMASAQDETNYDSQLQNLQNLVQDQVTTLLTDPSPSVKRSLLSNIAPLCAFFGTTKTNDVLLSHMITYLNDRNWLLREAFFEAIVGVSSVVGGRSLKEYILPLMTQALSDTEDFVVARVIHGLTRLVQAQLFEKARILDLLGSVVGFLCHPNIWIRESAAGYIAAAVMQLEETDVWSIVYPSIRPLLKTDVAVLTEQTLLDFVKRPLSRAVLQGATAWAAKSSKTSFWKPTQEGRGKAGLGNGLGKEGVSLMAAQQPPERTPIPRTEEDDAHLDKLRALGMNVDDEVKLIALRDYIWKLARQAATNRNVNSLDADEAVADSRVTSGLEVQSLDGITPQTIFFSSKPSSSSSTSHTPDGASFAPGSLRSQQDGSFSGRLARRRLAGSRIPSEMTNMITADDLRRRMSSSTFTRPISVVTSEPSTPSKGEMKSATGTISPSTARPISPTLSGAQGRLGVVKAAPAIASVRATAVGTMSDLNTKVRAQDDDVSVGPATPIPSATPRAQAPHEADDSPSFSSTYDGHDPWIRAHLDAVYAHSFRDRAPEYGPRITAGVSRRRGRTSVTTGSRGGSGNKRPEGNLIAYFTEHTGPITCLAVSPDQFFFVSGSEDGTVKVWDTVHLEKNVTSRSRATYAAQKGAITAVLALEASHCIASTATDGSLHVWRVDVSHSSSMPRYSKPKLVSNFQLSTPDEYVTCLLQTTAEASSTLILGTSHSRLTTIDLRTMQVLEAYTNPVHYGPISCLCTDRKKTWLLVGTLGGILSLWDLRFGLLLKSWPVGMSDAGSGITASKASQTAVRINKITLHPGRGRGRWVLVAFERLTDGPAESSHDGRRPSRKAVTEVLVETWDIDKGARVETFETGAFSRSKDTAGTAADDQRDPQNDEAVEAETTRALPAHEASANRLTGAAAAIEQLVQQQLKSAQARSEEQIDVAEIPSDEEGEERSAPTSGAIRSHLQPNLASHAGVKALIVGMDTYASSALPTAGQVAGGWLDAGKLAEEASSNNASASGNGPVGFMITGGEDRKIRFWDLGRTEKGVCLGLLDERSEFRTISSGAAATDSSATRHIHSLHHASSSTTSRLSSLRSPLLAHAQTQYAAAQMRAHRDAITALALLEVPFRCIVAGDRAGVVRVWE